MYVFLLDSKTETLITPDTNPNPIYSIPDPSLQYPTLPVHTCPVTVHPTLPYPTLSCRTIPSLALPFCNLLCPSYPRPFPITTLHSLYVSNTLFSVRCSLQICLWFVHFPPESGLFRSLLLRFLPTSPPLPLRTRTPALPPPRDPE